MVHFKINNAAVALVTVIVFVLLSTIIAVALFSLMTNEARLIEHQIRRIRAMYAAESGIQQAMWQLRQNPPQAVTNLTVFGSVPLDVTVTDNPGGPSGTRIISATVNYQVF
ncbi:MAG: PilX N-terminal domain-containing pilus assembly protein [Candidatus Omnitrophota bacterium]